MKTQRLLTEAEAWREIGRRIEECEDSEGLCIEVAELCHEAHAITVETKEAMAARIDAFRAERGCGVGAYIWPFWEPGPRIIACELNAILAEQDEALARR